MITSKRLFVWGIGLLGLTWFIYLHTMMVPGLIDRAGRFKGTDYIQFYVMGSLLRDGRADALYDGHAHLEEGRRRIDSDLTLYAAYPNYGPQVALLFTPMARLPFGWSLALFLSIMSLCYGISVWLLWRDCEGLRSYGPLVAVLAAGSPLFYTMILYGQLSAIALLFWSAGCAAMRRNRPFVAGLALGCLVYKPTLGFVFGLVLLVSRQRRLVAGAVAAAAVQLGVGVLVAGVKPLVQYTHVLWTLMLNPQLVQVFPTELHSLRGFFQLLIASPVAIGVCFALALVFLLMVALRSWQSEAPVALRWSQLVLLTVLASPHLLAYDLVVLTLPLLLFADWAVRHADHPLRPAVNLLLVLVYFAPFSSVLARVSGVQLSVAVMAILAWRMYRVCEGECHGCPAKAGCHAGPAKAGLYECETDNLAIVAPR